MQHLNTTGLFHMDLRLNRTLEALAVLLPQHTMRVVQVLGTNGKGSTSTFLAALSRAHGLRTGLYTSPHFVSPRERIRINGHMLPEAVWLRWGNRIHSVAPTLTYFECITVLAICAFQEAGVDVAIMEAGLGGRHDATTALHADMLCYTPIAMDHESVLGDSLAAIAADKAAAIRQGATVISGPQEPEVLAILQDSAASAGSPLILVGDPLICAGAPLICAGDPLICAGSTPHASASLSADIFNLPANTHLQLHGAHQQANARLAITAWQHLTQNLAQLHGWDVLPASQERIRNALEQAFIPGRLQYVPPQRGLPALFLDGGHNPHGLTALTAALRRQTAPPQAVIFSCLADKNIAGMVHPLRELAGTAPIIVPTIADNPRACSSAELAKHIGPQAVPVGTLSEALAMLEALVCAPESFSALSPSAHNAGQSVPSTVHTQQGVEQGAEQDTEQEPATQHTTSASQPYAVVCGSLYLLSELYTLYPDLLEPALCTQEPV